MGHQSADASIATPVPSVSKQNVANSPVMGTPDLKRPRYRKMIEASKDDGRYYDSSTERELRQAAEAGDEWAMRELRWPEGHEFHRLGRPFFRNRGPHPHGLFPNSGY